MKAFVSKLGAVVTVHNILSVVFVAYIGNAIHQLYGLSQVPLYAADAVNTRPVSSHMKLNQTFDMHVFMSTHPTVGKDDSVYLGNFTGIVYSDSFNEEEALSSSGGKGTLNVENLVLPDEMCGQNRTLYLHTYARVGAKLVNSRSFQLSHKLIPMDDRDSKHFLLDPSYNATEAAMDEKTWPYTSIPSKIEIGVITETRAMDMQKMIEKGFSRYMDVSKGTLMLPLHVNPYITPRDEYVSLLDCPKVNLEVVYKPVGISYWMLSDILLRSFDNLEGSLKVNEYDIDSFKMLVTGSSTMKLAIVYLVSLLHFVFEYLSIKSDLSFWKSRTNFNGLSESSISMNVMMGGISALYVIEQQEGNLALYFILIKMGMNLWKIWKMRKSNLPKNQTEIEIHDAEMRGMKYLALVLVPVVVVFCVHRLIYYKYRSWYSWAILSLAAASEVFGFVTMTPQIFLNHRLKSVEHLPWTALTYSFINTFIDDLFAFGIFRVPEVSKYSCLRDDIVFVVICVQRWLYSGRREEDEKPIREKKQQ